jgi:hypothetical protein
MIVMRYCIMLTVISWVEIISNRAISHYPKGIPHGPAPGAMERSHKETHELAVMVDT